MIGFLQNRKKEVLAQEADVIEILEVKTTETAVRLIVRFGGKTWRELRDFVRQKGFVRAGDGLSLLLAYGLSEREGIDIEKRHAEMMAIGSRYAAMSFEAYTLFDRNRALTTALSVILPENRRLRREAEELGLIPASAEVWDSWDQQKVSDFYKRYVFVR